MRIEDRTTGLTELAAQLRKAEHEQGCDQEGGQHPEHGGRPHDGHGFARKEEDPRADHDIEAESQKSNERQTS